MTKDKAYLVGTSIHSYRQGEPAAITGVVIVTPGPTPNTQHQSRPCFSIRFSDGTVDYIAISDSDNYKIVTMNQIILQNY